MPDEDNKDIMLRAGMKRFEETLDPAVTKFTPKQAAGPPPMALQVEQIREYARQLLKTCDELDKIVAASEADTRKAADILITMAGRIK